jgi:hypothetical protein
MNLRSSIAFSYTYMSERSEHKCVRFLLSTCILVLVKWKHTSPNFCYVYRYTSQNFSSVYVHFSEFYKCKRFRACCQLDQWAFDLPMQIGFHEPFYPRTWRFPICLHLSGGFPSMDWKPARFIILRNVSSNSCGSRDVTDFSSFRNFTKFKSDFYFCT